MTLFVNIFCVDTTLCAAKLCELGAANFCELGAPSASCAVT